ncbi:hypothetical protein WDW89_08515 [Deltaproteobacteria bacterium TL4]
MFQCLINDREDETIYHFNENAENIVREYQHQLNVEARDVDPYLYSPIRKLRTYVLRFCLILHCIRGKDKEVNEETALFATLLINHLKENIEKAFHIVFQSKKEEQQTMIIEKVRAMEGKATKDDIKHRLKRHIPYKECGLFIDELVKNKILTEYKEERRKKVFLTLS